MNEVLITLLVINSVFLFDYSCATSRQEWASISSTDNESLYVDTKSILQEGTQNTAWVRRENTDYILSLIKVSIACETRELNVVEGLGQTIDGKIFTASLESPYKLTEILPARYTDVVYNYFCQGIN